MGKRLIITEKPSVARDIAAALGGFVANEEYYESDEYVMTWVIGHLIELAEPQDYDKKWSSWSIKNLPILPDSFEVKPKEGQQKRLDAIQKLGTRKDLSGIINACDAAREGELIFRRIAEFAHLDELPQQRLWLQSMTTDAIRTAFGALRPGKEFNTLADAAFCRAVGDWLVGMNATRALTQRLKSRGEKDSWSAGRVQTPSLNLLVGREREILAHIPRPYWEIAASFQHQQQTWEARFFDPEARAIRDEEDETGDPEAKPSRLFERERVDAILKALELNPHGDASEKRRKSKQSPPLPFDLTSLQREANRRFGLSAKRTSNAAQRLYEAHKLLTYPRTDSRHLPNDYAGKIPEILEGVGRMSEWRELCTEVAAAPQNLDKVLDDTKVTDHFAIVPTGNLPETPLGGDEERVFQLVLRQFLASLMGAATWSSVERIVQIPVASEMGGTARFRLTTRTLEEPGFHRALGTTSEVVPLPPLVPGQDTATGVKVDRLEWREEARDTKPPPRFSEAQLLRMMETAGERVTEEEFSDVMKGRGIGTPATRADIIEGLVSKGYARRVEGRLGPTSKGMRLMDILERVKVGALASPKLTGEWEFALQEVQAGRLTRAEMVDRLKSFTADVTGALVSFEHDQLYKDDPDLGLCPSCSEGRVIESAWGYRCSRNDGAGSACDFIIWKDRAGRFVDRRLAELLIRDRKVGPVAGFVDRAGRPLEAHLTLERDPEREDRWGIRIDYGAGSDEGPEVVRQPIFPCTAHPDCQIIETSRRYVCEKVFDKTERSGPQLPKIVCQREISVEEAESFFGAAARTEVLEGFTSRRNRPFKGALVRKETGKHGFEFPPRPGEVEGETPRRGRGKKKEETEKEDSKPKRGKKAAAEVETPKKAKKAMSTKAAPKATKGKATSTKAIEVEAVSKKSESKATKGKAAPSTAEVETKPTKPKVKAAATGKKKAAAKKAPAKAKKASAKEKSPSEAS